MPDRARAAFGLLRPRRTLFVASHMRSYSTLLTHILGSHPEVSGYVETHQAYQRPRDLLALRLHVLRSTGGGRLGRILVDKLLHNYADVAPSVVARDDVQVVFVVREPVRTIQSTIVMALRRDDVEGDWKTDPVKVGRYYVRRLGRLVETAEAKPAGSAYFDADRLVEDTDAVLEGLTRFLGLSTPLRPRYERFAHTGEPVWGDPGRYIAEGEIVREREAYEDVAVPPEVVAEAAAAYREASERLAALVEVTW